jgi:hypothetical protein
MYFHRPLLLVTSIVATTSRRAVGHAIKRREEEKEVALFQIEN